MRREIHELNWWGMELELEQMLTPYFWKVWLQYSKLGNIVVICFPNNRLESYRIFSMRDVSVDTISTEYLYENICSQMSKI